MTKDWVGDEALSTGSLRNGDQLLPRKSLYSPKVQMVRNIAQQQVGLSLCSLTGTPNYRSRLRGSRHHLSTWRAQCVLKTTGG